MGAVLHHPVIALLGNSTIKLSAGWNAFFFWGIWAVCIIGIGICVWSAFFDKKFDRWTTQDLLIVASLAVVLEVYDNVVGDQFIAPIIERIPGMDLIQAHDLPYMFLLMVGVALVRKPGCVTAMVFINYLLAQLLFGSGHGALDWTDGFTQGIFCDLYIVARRGRVYAPSASILAMIVDGLMIGALRGGPNAFFTDWSFDPYLNATYYTWYQMWVDTWSNTLGNAVEAALSAVLALRVAKAVVPSIGRRRVAGAVEVDPFAEPAAAGAGAGSGTIAVPPPAVPPQASAPDNVTPEGERA